LSPLDIDVTQVNGSIGEIGQVRRQIAGAVGQVERQIAGAVRQVERQIAGAFRQVERQIAGAVWRSHLQRPTISIIEGWLGRSVIIHFCYWCSRKSVLIPDKLVPARVYRQDRDLRPKHKARLYQQPSQGQTLVPGASKAKQIFFITLETWIALLAKT
jgi:hypothetical protein